MPIPTSLTDLSTTPSSNSPQGTESAKGTIDDYLRAHAAFIKQISDLVLGQTVTLPSASLVSIGFAASSNINITGTTTINAFDNYAEGALRYVAFSGAMVLAHGAALALPGSANITTASGDVAVFKSSGGGNWKCILYQRASGSGPVAASASKDGYLSAADWAVFNGKQAALGFTPYNATNPAGYISNISGAQVTAALGYTPQAALGFTPYNSSNPAGYITGINSAQVVSALGYTPQATLGYTPYNSSNPAGYISNVASALGYTPANAGGQAFTGNISAPVITQTSDERKKCNWRPLTDAQLDALANMELAGLFDWKDGSGSSLGGSAQEIARIVPEAKHEDEEGNITVNYGGLCFAMQQAALRRLWGAK